ncbi:IPT/TIG domain-containing protein [Niabella insulamsoli]|uniref:IPT/TIG domain-containing protein n=1 Tax=Niabella insulamsoli TaxID=3144874 RepID=UPI0031FCE44F
MKSMLSNTWRYVCAMLLTTTIFLSACDKNDEDMTDEGVQLYSFGPTGVQHGEEISFIGAHLDQVSAITFTGVNAAVDKADFKSQSATRITLIVPAAAERGPVTLIANGAEIKSKTMFDLGVGPTVASITNEARPGTDITINGTYLNWVTSVTFSDEKVVTDFTTRSQNELVVTVPEDAKTGPLVLAFSGTEPGDFETEQVLTVTLPVVAGVSPAIAKHADQITLTGTNLDLIKKIYFNNVTAAVTEFVSQSATQLVVKVPGATKKGKLKLEVASGVQTESAAELDVVMPAITSMSPIPVDPGTNLTITGTNLNLVTSILFENITNPVSSFVSQSASQIVVQIPMGIANGLVTLNVANSSLKVQSADVLEIAGAAPPPTIALHLYNDMLVNWNGWLGDGWGGTRDYANTTPVRVGAKSIKVTYNAGSWGSPIQLGGGSLNIAAYSMFKLSVYPTAATAGMTVTVQFNGAGGYALKLGKAGEWTDHAIPISNISAATEVTQITMQDAQGVGGTIYVDEIGFN